MRLLFLYSTREGQTKKILQKIAEKNVEHESTFIDIHSSPKVNFSNYDRVLIGASIRYGRLNSKLYEFVTNYHKELAEINAAFICVNLTARKEAEGKDSPEGSVYIRTFLRKSPWQPNLIGVFAGALRYPRYGVFDKMMIRLIMTLTGGETDTSKEVEYTNWGKVEQFSDRFMQ